MASSEELKAWQNRTQVLVGRYIKKHLGSECIDVVGELGWGGDYCFFFR